jgi:solute carrier family 25 (mitochondrial carnitine/acylcarnitine transporter), member 20/29
VEKSPGSLEAGRKVFRRHGTRGLYLGFQSTLVREVTANAVYFYSYEYIMRLFAGNKSASHAPIEAAFLAGGLGGTFSWMMTYPIDYVKTVMQSQDLDRLKYRSPWHCAVVQHRKEGFKTFFKGMGITLLRSFPVNGTAFFAFEYFMRLMGWRKQ